MTSPGQVAALRAQVARLEALLKQEQRKNLTANLLRDAAQEMRRPDSLDRKLADAMHKPVAGRGVPSKETSA